MSPAAAVWRDGPSLEPLLTLALLSESMSFTVPRQIFLRSRAPGDIWVRSLGCLIEFEVKCSSDTCTISRIGFGAVGDVAQLDFKSGITHGAGGVLEQNLLLGGAHLPKQIAGLFIVIVNDAMVPIRRIALDRQRRSDQRLVAVDPGALAVGPIARCGAEIAVGSH